MYIRVVFFLVLFAVTCAQAQPVNDKLIEPAVNETYLTWNVSRGVFLNVQGVKSSIYAKSNTYEINKLNLAKEQNEQFFRPAWDFFGLVLDERDKHRWNSGYSSDEYYVEAKIKMRAEIEISEVYRNYDVNDKPRIARVVVDGIVVCGDGVYCKESLDFESNGNKFEVDVILDKISNGEPIQVDLTFDKPIDQNNKLSAKYFLDTNKAKSLIERAVYKGRLEADKHNAQADIVRGDIVRAAKVQYFIYFIYLMVALALINNRAHLYQFGKRFALLFKIFFSFIYIYPRMFLRYLKARLFGEKSIIMKSDGLTKVSVSEELMRWNQLRESNVISEEDFNKVKEKLLETLRNNDVKK